MEISAAAAGGGRIKSLPVLFLKQHKKILLISRYKNNILMLNLVNNTLICWGLETFTNLYVIQTVVTSPGL
jgi:hypothetical protein